MKSILVALFLTLASCQHFPYGRDLPPVPESAHMETSAAPEIKPSDLPLYKNADYFALIRAYFYSGSDSFSEKLSGFILCHKDRYYVITASHLTQNTNNFSNIRVWFKNNPEKAEEMRLLGYDPAIDTAVLGFKDKDFKFDGQVAVLGNSDDLKIRDTVYGLGHPLGFFWKISDGWVKSLDTKLSRHYCTATLMEHNAVSGVGGSGGPVINEKGEVVGMNVQIFPRREGSKISSRVLAVPINTIKSRLDDLIAGYKP